MATRNNRHWWLALALLGLLAGLWFWLRPQERSSSGTAPKTAAKGGTSPLVASSEGDEKASIMDRASVAAVLRENAAAGRVVFLTFQLDADGAHLVSARGAQGRAGTAWTPGLRRGILVYELRDGAGAVLAEGEVEDPLNRRLEYESQGGGIASTWVSLESAELMLRLPGLPTPASIELYRGAADEPARRVSIGRIQLQ